MTYAKAIGGGLAVLVAFIVGEVWIELPEPVTAALATVLTAGVVAIIKNREKPVRNDEAGHSVIELLFALILVVLLVWLLAYLLP